MEQNEARQQPEPARSRQRTAQMQAQRELSDEQLDRVAGGSKDIWPDPKRNELPSSEPSIAR